MSTPIVIGILGTIILVILAIFWALSRDEKQLFTGDLEEDQDNSINLDSPRKQ